MPILQIFNIFSLHVHIFSIYFQYFFIYLRLFISFPFTSLMIFTYFPL